jgi:hypothetical protein
MRRAAIVFAGFAALLGLTTAVLALMDGKTLPLGLLGGAAAASLLTSVGLFAAGAGAPDTDPDLVRPVPDASYATAVLAVGICLVVFGFVFGSFMVLIGAGVALSGLAGLAREQLALRRERRRVEAA